MKNYDEAFRQDVLDNPKDDAPRLVYADWLQDNGDPDRAEFIRLQCRLLALPEYDEQVPRLQAREEELLEANRATWAKEVLPLVRDCKFRRGFVAWVELTGQQFTDNEDKLFASAPLEAPKNE